MPNKLHWFEFAATIIKRRRNEIGEPVVIFDAENGITLEVHKSAVFAESPASIIQRQAERIAELEDHEKRSDAIEQAAWALIFAYDGHDYDNKRDALRDALEAPRHAAKVLKEEKHDGTA